MKKRILSLCLSAAVVISSSAVCGFAVRAAESAGEGATTTEAVTTETAPAEEEISTSSEAEVPTDAAGNVITPETAQAIDSADLGVTNIAPEEAASEEESPEAAEEAKVAEAAEAAEAAMQAPETDESEMDKSTIGAAFDSSYQFNKEDVIVYLVEAAAVKAEPSDDAEEIASLDKYSSILLSGSNDSKYWEVRIAGTIGYLDSSVITRDRAEIEALKEDDVRKEENEAQSKQEQEETIVEKTSEAKEEWAQALKDERRSELANQTRSLNWSGPVLSRSKGSVYGPSGKETYYNLNMSGCVRNMNRRGYYYDVWVRNDGCKMFGDYIMCAANLGVHPFGSLVECSLGTCIVVDTGGFAAGNPNQLDIAVTW